MRSPPARPTPQPPGRVALDGEFVRPLPFRVGWSWCALSPTPGFFSHAGWACRSTSATPARGSTPDTGGLALKKSAVPVGQVWRTRPADPAGRGVKRSSAGARVTDEHPGDPTQAEGSCEASGAHTQWFRPHGARGNHHRGHIRQCRWWGYPHGHSGSDGRWGLELPARSLPLDQTTEPALGVPLLGRRSRRRGDTSRACGTGLRPHAPDGSNAQSCPPHLKPPGRCTCPWQH